MGCRFDEDKFPDAWRINSSDCKISEGDKTALVFLIPLKALSYGKCIYQMNFFI